MRVHRIKTAVTIIAWIWRFMVIFVFAYLSYVHIYRYFDEGIFTRVRRFKMPIPNMTFCQHDVETMQLSSDDSSETRLAANHSHSDAFRVYDAFIDHFSICIGGSGTRKERCEIRGGKTLGDWHTSIYYPDVVCLTYIPRAWYYGSRRLAINLGRHLHSGYNQTYMVIHVGPRGPVQPGQQTPAITVFNMRSGFVLRTALQLWEFRRVITHEAFCTDTPGYDKTLCSIECRWELAAAIVGCRDSWQLNLEERLSLCSASDKLKLHRAFLGTSTRQCGHKCLEPCLNRDYIIVQRYYDINVDFNSSLTVNLANSRLQVQEFVRFDGDRLMSSLGGNIGLLLGVSALSLVDIASALIETLWKAPAGQKRRDLAKLLTSDIHTFIE